MTAKKTDKPKQDDSLIAKLSRIQTHLVAGKGQTNAFGKYKYRSCEDILEALKPHLEREGLALIIRDSIEEIAGRVYVRANVQLTDGDGFYESEAFAREAADKKGMDAAQITGACSSYARKYALNGLFAIDDTKDADTMDNRMTREEADEDASEVPMNQAQALTSATASIKKLVKARGWDGPTLRKCIEAEFQTDFDKMTPAQLTDAVDWAQTWTIPGVEVKT
jgi:hypothetical protein